MTSAIDINTFMARFHALECELGLFERRIDGEPWWDTVRFDACYYLYDCLSGLSYSSAHNPPPPPRRLGVLRRWLLRQALFARALFRRDDLLVLRAPRAGGAGRSGDAVLDPLLAAIGNRSTVIDILPRRYHLPDPDARRWPGSVPTDLADIVRALLAGTGVAADRAATLEALIRRGRSEHAAGVAGYHRLFDRLRSKVVLLAGVDKPLCQVARARDVAVVEAQHGLIGFGHPAYSYPRAASLTGRSGFPDLFLGFSEFWLRGTHYPAARSEVIGTGHLATGVGPVRDPLGDVMVITANIYQDELSALVRKVATRLPTRRFILKLHPNQIGDERAIRTSLADLPNVDVGSAAVPALRMLGTVSHLVAIQSTVVYEALQQGRRVCLLARHDYHLHDDILGHDAVSVTTTVDELTVALAIPAATGQSPIFFERFNGAKARRLIADLLGRD